MSMIPTKIPIELDDPDFFNWIENAVFEALTGAYKAVSDHVQRTSNEISLLAAQDFGDSLTERMIRDLKAQAYDQILATISNKKFL